MIVIKISNGLWPLALKASGQPPLFWLSTGCIGPIEGPELESYPGIVFCISGLGINLPSTYCDIDGVVWRKNIFFTLACIITQFLSNSFLNEFFYLGFELECDILACLIHKRCYLV